MSWVNSYRYEGAEEGAKKAKEAVNAEVEKRLKEQQIIPPQIQLDFLLNLQYDRVRRGEAIQVEDELVKLLSDPEFSFRDFVLKRFSVPPSVAAMALATQEATSSSAEKADYKPDCEDEAHEVLYKRPNPGMELKHPTEAVPQELRTPQSILDLLPATAICISNLPNGPTAPTVEAYQRLCARFGSIEKCTLIHDINRIVWALLE